MHYPNRSCRTRRRPAGFTLVEIMIVILVIGILLNIAAPAFISARDKAQARSCVKALSDFVTAKEQYAMDNKVSESSPTPITWNNISSYVRVPTGTPATGPTCPANGAAYSYNNLATSPVCTYGGPAGNLHQY